MEDAVAYLKGKGVMDLDSLWCVHGWLCCHVSACNPGNLCEKAIIDAGVTPYPYPLIILKLIALKDLISIRIATKNEGLSKKIMPPYVLRFLAYYVRMQEFLVKNGLEEKLAEEEADNGKDE